MYFRTGIQIPCVNLPFDVELDDVMPWASDLETAKSMVKDGKVASFFVFVENSRQLKSSAVELIRAWEDKLNFWVFYPKKPHLSTDLSRDETWRIMKEKGMSGTRQVAIGDKWSCLYYKNTGKPVMESR